MSNTKMYPSELLKKYKTQIRSIVLSHRTTNVRVFGSVLHDKDNEQSDLITH